MSASPDLALPSDIIQTPEFARTLLDMSLTAVAVLQPLYDATHSRITDFAWVYLNLAGQRMLQQPERPAQSLLALFPTAQADGVFAKCCLAFETGELQRNQTNYQADGLDGYFLLVAQRCENLLVVNFTDTNDQPRSPVEKALRESQAREQAALAEAERQQQQLHHVLEQAPAMICIFNGPRHVFQFVNPPYQALVGDRPLLGKPIAEAMPELTGQPIFDLLDQVYQTGETFYAQEMLVQLDHHNEGSAELEKRYYNFIYQARRDAAGLVDGILVFAYEVTPQVQARQQVQQLNHELEARVQERTRQVQQQSHRLARLVQEAPAAIALLNGPELVFELLNDDYQALFPDRVLLDKPVLAAIPELRETPLAEILQNVYRTGETFEGQEFPIPFAEPGGLAYNRYFDFIYQARYNEFETIDGILVFGFDVTERVQRRQQTEALQAELLQVAERRAQEREDLYQVIAQTPVAVLLLREPSHRIDYCNPAFLDVFPPDDWAGGDLLGHELAEVYPRMREAGLVKLLDEVFATGVSQTVLEMPLAELQPGSPRYITFAYQPYREQGRIVGVAALAYDATEQVLARQQTQYLNEQLTSTNATLHTTNAQLSRVNADLDTFIYTASHDLRSPVSNIEGLIDALRQELLDEPIVRGDLECIIELMQKSVARFQTTIGELTDTIKVQQGGRKRERIELAQLVEDIRLDLAPALADAQAELRVDVHACPVLHGSPKDWRSIVFNLLSNAVKYRAAERPPLMQVSATCDERWVQLRVQDNGLGLTPEQQSQLFGLFTRLHDHVEGSGVGLYSIKKLVNNAGGTITVSSEVGVGSVFTVRLPV